jgi:hypothetical protein
MAKEKVKKSVVETIQRATRKVNNRRYPNAKTPRPDNYAMRKSEAEERRAVWEALSTKDKIACLDRRLGIGIGAVKQRARLQRELEKIAAPPQVASVEATQVEINTERRPQRVKAKERRNFERSKIERDTE